jgi:flagellin-specific chaperone FliS
VINRVKKILETTLEDWEMMMKASENESEECAERFEMHFYEFIDELKVWYEHLEQPPSSIEEAENINEIREIIERLPAPLELNFLTELELIIEGEERVRFD